MPRAIWSGSVSFGLVNVPIKLVTATSPKDVRFHQLHDEDGGRIEQKRVCSIDGEEVEYSHIVKGYDLGGGRTSGSTPEDLGCPRLEATRTIDIEEFVDLAEIDPSTTSAATTWSRRASREGLRLAGGDHVSHRQGRHRPLRAAHQAVSGHPRARDGVLVLATMLFDDEVVAPDDLEVPTATTPRPRSGR